jgi:hypothetical protein
MQGIHPEMDVQRNGIGLRLLRLRRMQRHQESFRHGRRMSSRLLPFSPRSVDETDAGWVNIFTSISWPLLISSIRFLYNTNPIIGSKAGE